jgi:hypothetical protein
MAMIAMTALMLAGRQAIERTVQTDPHRICRQSERIRMSHPFAEFWLGACLRISKCYPAQNGADKGSRDLSQWQETRFMGGQRITHAENIDLIFRTIGAGTNHWPPCEFGTV